MLFQPLATRPPNAVGQEQTVANHGSTKSDNDKKPAPPPTALPNVPTDNAGDKPSADSGNRNSDGSQWSLSDKIAFWAVAAGFLQFIALFWTILTMRKFSRRQLRAYIIPETGSIVNVADPDPTQGPKTETEARIIWANSGPAARIQIKNVGQTPAYGVLHWGCLEFREYPLRSILPDIPKDLDSNRSPVGPNVPITKSLRMPYRLADAEVKSLKDGTGCVYWNGVILYRDIFRKKHFTRYRLMYGAMGGSIGINTDLTFADDGNYTDDSQPRWWKRSRRQPSPLAQTIPNPPEPQAASGQPPAQANASPDTEADHSPEKAN